MGTQISQLNVPLSYVVSPDVKEIIYALNRTDEESDLAKIDGIFSKLADAAISLPLTYSNRQAITHQLAVHDVILKRLASIQAIQAGLEELGVLKLACKHPEIKSMLVIKEKVISSNSFQDLLSFPPCVCGSQELVIGYLRRYINAAEEKLLCTFLQYITGASSIPPMGFDTPLTVQFVDEKRLPFACTCTLQLLLSTQYESYEEFEKDIKISIAEQRFDCA